MDGAATAAPQRETWLLRPVADGLDVVAVRIADKCSEVVFVILRPDARLMQHLCSGRHGGVEERSHGGPVRRGERNVRLAEPRAGLMGANPEVRGWRPAVADDIAEVQDAFAAERGENGVVKYRASSDIRALQGHVIEHGAQPDINGLRHGAASGKKRENAVRARA